MNTDPIENDNPESLEEIQEKYDSATSIIWDVAEELGVEAATLTDAIIEIEEKLDASL